MILKESTIRSATLGSKGSQQFGISDNRVIFDILRNKLYTNPILAICREVASNARDANRENGKGNVPIQIAMKGSAQVIGMANDLFISFKDEGIGISPERMEKVFLLYGESTKRNTNDQTGGYGLGAKTPFAYSDTFMVQTVCEFEGKRTKYVYIAAIDTEEKGTMHLFLSSETEEPTGTEILIPVKDNDRHIFENDCCMVTRFWEVQPKLNNFLIKFEHPSKKVSFDLFDIHSSSNTLRHGSYLSIDGIPFSADYRNTSNLGSIAIKFKNGELNLAANREYVQSSDDNDRIIKERVDAVKSFMIEWLNKYIEKLPTYSHAVLFITRCGSYDLLCRPMSEEDFIATFFYNFLNNSENSINSSILKNGKSIIGYDALTVQVMEQDNASFISRSSHSRFYSATIRSFFKAFIYKNKHGKKKIPIYKVDTNDKVSKRVHTLFESNDRVLFYKEKTWTEYMLAQFNGKKEEEIYKDIEKNPAFKKKYNELKLLFDETSLKEKEHLNELFEIRNISDVKPSNYKNPKPPAKEDVVIKYKTYYKSNNSVYSNSETKTKTVPKKNGDLKKYVVFNIETLRDDDSYVDYTDRERMSLLLSMLRMFDNDYIPCATSPLFYKAMKKLGALSYDDFISSLTADQLTMIRDMNKLFHLEPNIRNMVFELEVEIPDIKEITEKLSKKQKELLCENERGILQLSGFIPKMIIPDSDELAKIRDINKKYKLLRWMDENMLSRNDYTHDSEKRSKEAFKQDVTEYITSLNTVK